MRIVLFAIITWLLIAQFFLPALFLAICYLIKYRGYELMILAVLVDGYFKAFYSLPIISIGTITVIFLVEVIKPYVLLYTEQT